MNVQMKVKKHLKIITIIHLEAVDGIQAVMIMQELGIIPLELVLVLGML